MSARLRRASLLLAAACAMLATPLRAQHDPAPGTRPRNAPPAPAGAPRTVRGEVVRSTPGGDRAVPREWVTLHRVSRGGSGPVDSVRTDADGRYAFRYAAGDTSEAMYIVSTQYGGIAYFSAPLHHEEVSGDEARLTVFDTTSGPLPIRVRGRHVVVSGADADGRRTVFEIFELSNDTTLTLVATDSGATTFATILPDAADSPAVSQGDIAASAVRFRAGRAEVLAPIAPGLRQLAITYALPPSAFPLSIPVENGADVLEVLLEERAGSASGARLVEGDTVLVEGRRFRRFLAQEVPARAVATIAVPAARTASGDRTIMLLVAALAALMFGGAWVAMRRTPRVGPAAQAVIGQPSPVSGPSGEATDDRESTTDDR